MVFSIMRCLPFSFQRYVLHHLRDKLLGDAQEAEEVRQVLPERRAELHVEDWVPLAPLGLDPPIKVVCESQHIFLTPKVCI